MTGDTGIGTGEGSGAGLRTEGAATATRPTPGWGRIAQRQLRTLVLLQRKDFLVVGVLLGLLAAVLVWGLTEAQVQMQDAPTSVGQSIPVFWLLVVPLTLVGAVWPFGVWRDDAPSRRGYFWSLPVPRGPHTLLRVFLGWVLLQGVVLGTMAVVGGIALIYAGRFEAFSPSFELWFSAPLTATLSYLVVSVLTVSVENPVRWGIWGAIAVAVTGIFSGATGLSWLAAATGGVMTSLSIALTGPAPELAGPLPFSWLTHYLIWFALGLIGVLAGAFVHRDAS